jgi:very-short-patch-repair endonuclease
MTDTERFVWQRVRYRQLDRHKFRRQQPLGPYVVDFVCLERRLVLELDGGQHAEQAEEDAPRARWLEARGFRVVRFWNHDVLGNWDGVLQVIWGCLQSPPPQPSPARGEGVRKRRPPE